MIRIVSVSFLLVGTMSSASAQVIADRSFFDTLPSTLIDFETRVDGTPVVLRPGDSETLPAREYSSQGVTFNMDIEWVNDALLEFDAAQAIGGSPDIGIPAAADDFTMFFDAPVRAFGFWVVNNRTVATDPRFEAFDASGASLGVAVFNGDLVDGVIGGIAEYGFMGIASPGAPIASVRITKDATMFDDLIYTTVPAPASTTAIILGVLSGIRRRR